jgi:iron-sulfur cluster assembly protein
MISLSPSAVREINRLKSKLANPEMSFRLQVQSGGCSGLVYHMGFDAANSRDRIYQCNGLSVVVDEESYRYVENLNLDYSEDLMGGAFRFHNPKSVSVCGCGNSFAVEI